MTMLFALTLYMLQCNSADNKLMTFFSYFSQKMGIDMFDANGFPIRQFAWNVNSYIFLITFGNIFQNVVCNVKG